MHRAGALLKPKETTLPTPRLHNWHLSKLLRQPRPHPFRHSCAAQTPQLTTDMLPRRGDELAPSPALRRPRARPVRDEQRARTEKRGCQFPLRAGRGRTAVEELRVRVPAREVESGGGACRPDGEPVVLEMGAAEEGVGEGEEGKERGQDVSVDGRAGPGVERRRERFGV